MELRVIQDKIMINENVYDGSTEQSIECDMMLPDYCPDIQKILKCKATPRITNKQLSADKVYIEGVVDIKVLYLAPDVKGIKTASTQIAFSKTMDARQAMMSPYITVNSNIAYLNCRAVNSRRMDIRGALSLAVKIMNNKEEEVISDVCGGKVQLKKKKVEISSAKIVKEKIFTLKDELELGFGKPSVETILKTDANASISEFKIIPNKIIIKGEVKINTLYLTSDDKIETIDFALPISQIIDVDNVDENCKCYINLEVMSVSIDIKADSESEGSIFDVSVTISAYVKAVKDEEINLITDAFSTSNMLMVKSKDIALEKLCEIINDKFSVKNIIEIEGDGVTAINAVWCVPHILNVTVNDKIMNINGNNMVDILAVDNDETPIYMEKVCDFNIELPIDESYKNLRWELDVSPMSVSFNIVDYNRIEVRLEMKISGCIYNMFEGKALSEINIDNDSVVENNKRGNLVIYFAQKGESVFGIAKKYNTEVNSIMLENELTDDNLSSNKSLLIPIMD